MITISRHLMQRFRTLMRKAQLGKTPGQPDAFVHLAGGPDGLRIRATGLSVAIEYHQPGALSPTEAWLPSELLEAAGGRRAEPVTVEPRGKQEVSLAWSDEGVPQLAVRTVEPPKNIVGPELPQTLVANPPQLWPALREAVATTAQERIRFALDCVQLRGSCGQVVASDGRQILAQGGFRLPWSDDLLLPASPVLGAKELAPESQIGVGRADEWVSFRVDRWRISLRVEKAARYPQVEDCFPQAAAVIARLEISGPDAAFLQRVLGSLPQADDHRPAATLDLNGQVVVRGRGAGQNRPTELVLASSRLEGDPVVVHTDRRFLARAVALGFRQFRLFGAASPLLAEDDQRRFLWAVLDADSAIPPATNAIRIESSSFAAEPTISRNIRRAKMTKPATAAAAAAPESPAAVKSAKRTTRPRVASTATPIEQAVALRHALRSAASQANELIRSLKHQKRQVRLVQSTLDSLKALQKVAG